ncbi:MAG TPA: glycosyl hydrolase family 65 protein [Herpetosiphonaceae bacterium]
MIRTTQQSLRFGPVALEASDPRPAPYFLSGRKLYAIGTTNGALEPVGAEHLVGEMGGVWAHPVKFLDGWYLSIQDQLGRDDLLRCQAFEGHLSDVTMQFAHGPLRISRTDFVADDEAVLFSLIEIANTGATAWSGKLGFVAQVNILPTWFSGWERGGVEMLQDHGLVVAFDKLWQGRWGVVFGSSTMPGEIAFGKRDRSHTAELRYNLTLQPDERVNLEFLVACDHQNGHYGALQLFGNATGRGAELLQHKRERYHKTALEGVALSTPDQQINHDWILAKANLLMLEADYGPYLPGFLLAGIPEYPQLFGCDNTYTTPGATAAGFTTIMRSTLGLLGDHARRACGRVPHEITTNGRVFNPGNTQETPQFAMAVWDYIRWTGDISFLRVIYPVCREGVMDYLPGIWDWDRDGYPTGDAMVERTGMGSLKLDSACYLYGAWRALAEMARVLGRPEAEDYARLANDWLHRFERDWWLPDQGLYADSLHSDYRPQLDGHWTQVVPVQLGIARPDRAVRVLETLEREFTNRWGLVHTRDREDRVWTLPTGLMVLAELRYGRVEHALRFLSNISLTVRQGMLGAFKELIPEGLCFVQLWSAGLYLQGWLEGVLGLDPRAHEHRLSIAPVLPEAWPSATVSGLRVGAHLLNITVARSGCTVEHLQGPQAIGISFSPRGTAVAAIETTGYSPSLPARHSTMLGDSLVFEVGVGQQVAVQIDAGRAQIAYGDRRSAAVSVEVA